MIFNRSRKDNNMEFNRLPEEYVRNEYYTEWKQSYNSYDRVRTDVLIYPVRFS